MFYNLTKLTGLLCFLQVCLSGRATLTRDYEEAILYPDGSDSRDQEVPVYNHMVSWLLLEALLFLIPNVAWQLFARRLGCPLSVISSRVQDLLSFTSQEVKNNAINDVATLVGGYCTRNARSRRSSYAFFWCYGNLPYIGYLFLMVTHTANVIAQFFVLSSLLGIPYYRYGFEALAVKWQPMLNMTGEEAFVGLDYLVHTTLTAPISFPKLVLCDFNVRRLGNVQRYMVQCNLLMSDFNASLLLFIWFFLFVVACLTAFGTVIFLFEFLFGGCIGQDVGAIVSGDSGRGFGGHSPRGGNRQATMKVTEFRSSFLGRDGLFTLHTISENAGSVIAERVIMELWRSYQDDHGQTAESATGEPAAHSDIMERVRQGNPRGSYTAGPSGGIAGGQDVELVSAAEGQNFNHEPPAYGQTTMHVGVTPRQGSNPEKSAGPQPFV